MSKRIIPCWLPETQIIRHAAGLRWLGRFLDHPGLWQRNRRSVSGAVGVGLFWAFLPVPTQMLPAAATAALLRVHLPLSLALTWVANPVTMPVVFYGNYRLGTWLLQAKPATFDPEWNWVWVLNRLAVVWPPLLLGSLVAASAVATLGYIGTRVYWRLRIVRRWRHRA